MSYSIEVERRAKKELARLPKQIRDRIVAAIDDLSETVRPPGCVPVHNAPKGTYRIRVGDYRVIYVIMDNEQVVVIARIASRNERTYKNL